ncbi:GAF domain-containing protein [Anabaena cylindrica FACHB-243]|uniref:histidine kinase n=1 Tax=Anabaena cylindrica (strain ATCC 27899 / PCC 7122) TaxID=272123 RepID=K9ZI18_ANACC|nr:MULTISPECIES: GAF domain-containing protein [Anabaena]AFZ57995.1 multi-sensor signal transduction histidine kinase [Anabaena cylindrica PCC 7122]MBD2420759.1 GAF domain-containing protein [Anabaena cylindrica FACHB-243]MBY5282725.1 GAF domain-containing protein [Anabaena sp. CCAP 1446/1C]MBY5311172.1 GAF domain-containing protein [Anabaena sp. CCAP 1446/1C]MCM2408222.1 GAF domain-containing protein [Anabaena sp. CCAP 1446/1C]
MFVPAKAHTQAELRLAIVRDPLLVTPETTVVEAIAQMSGVRSVCSVSQNTDSKQESLLAEARSSCVVVVENNQPIGIFTERDVVRLSAQRRKLNNLAIRDVMAYPLVTLYESEFTDLFFAINLLQHHKIRHLPVIDEQNQLVGLLTHESLRQKSRPVDLLRLRLVSEVMTTKVICAAPHISILMIARLMAENRISSVVIVQTQASLIIPIGIVTERDIVQFQALDLNFETCLAEAVMSTPIFCVNADESLWNVQQIMEQRLIQRLAVTGTNGELLGIVTQSSILQVLNPLELYKLTELLEKKVSQLEAEKIELLENRTVELEEEVGERTIALRKKIVREQLITKIAAQIRSSLNLQDILNTTVAEMRSLLQCDRVIIYQFRPDFSGTVIAESIVANGVSILHDEPQDPCITPEWLEPYRQGQIRVINDIHSESMSDCYQDMLIELDIRAKLMVPIVIAEQLWGLILTSYRDQSHNWELEEIELVRQLSIQLSVAIQQAQTHQQLYQLNQELENQIQERTKALQASEAKYRNLVEAATHVTWLCNTKGELIYLSPQFQELFGWEVEKFYGQSFISLIHPDDRPYMISTSEELGKSDKNLVSAEFRHLHQNGSYIWVESKASNLKDASGVIIGCQGVLLDISDRKQAEKIIKQQAEREHLLYQTTQRIRQSLDLATIFNTATQEIRQFMNADRVVIFQLDPVSNFNDSKFVSESVVEGFTSALATKINNKCFGEQYAAHYQQGRIQVVDDLDNAGLTDCHRDVLAQFQVRANLVVPLLQGENLWGLLCIHQCSVPRHWQEFEVELVQQIAHQLAIAIQQSILYEQVQSELIIRKQAEDAISLQLQRQKIIQDITQQIRSTLNVNHILATVTQQVKELMQVERVIIFRLFPNGRSQIVEEVVSSEYAALKNYHWEDEKWSQEILDCYWQGKPRIVPDVINDIWTSCLVEYTTQGNIQSKIVAPILQELGENETGRWVSSEHKQKLWGVLVVHACSTKRVWEEDEAQLLQQIANQLAIAIQQAALFEQLQLSLVQEKEVSKMRSRFITMASHEFRTPLAIIASSTGILQKFRERLSAEKQQEHLGTIQKTIKHIIQLLDDVLMINRTEAEKMEFKPEASDIIAFCHQITQQIEATSNKHVIEFSFTASKPILDNSFIVQLDKKILQQILANILTNAIKYSPQTSLIKFDLTIEDDKLIFKIKDSGIGIPEEYKINLFAPFHRASNVGTISGTGLGLSIVKKCVDLHKGEISFDSKLGQGTTFTIIIPYSRIQESGVRSQE